MSPIPPPSPATAAPARRHPLAWPTAVALTGLTSGVAGLSLALLLHGIQHLAYGYSLTSLVGTESFLDGVSNASPLRRLAVLVACGAVAGLGWWALTRLGAPRVSVRTAIDDPDKPLPPMTTIANALLQIVTVALGSPLGRETAPRELGALFAEWVRRTLGLTGEEARILLACGAGAALAAVYNVPFGGALFVMETLLFSIAPAVALPALATSVIAACVSWIGLGDIYDYTLPPVPLGGGHLVWAGLSAPVIGAAAWGYARLAERARADAAGGTALILSCLGVFTAVGLLAMAFPQLPGNGRGPIQLGLAGEMTLGLAAMLLVLKVASTLACLRAGATGGLMTPGMTIGALLAVLLAGAWGLVLPLPAAQGPYALIGGVAFIAVSMRMPVTAVVLGFEFARAGHDFAVPMLIAVALGTASARLCERWAASLPRRA